MLRVHVTAQRLDSNKRAAAVGADATQQAGVEFTAYTRTHWQHDTDQVLLSYR